MIKKEESALIIVDVQNDFCSGGTLAVPKGEEVVPVINQLIALNVFTIVATQDWHPEKHCSFIEQGGIWPDHCVVSTRGVELHCDLKLASQDCILIRKGTELNKDAYSGFEETQLEKILKNSNIKQAFVCGLATDYCVKATAFDAQKAGFETFVIIDACRGVEVKKEDIKKSIKEMKEMGIKIISSKNLMKQVKLSKKLSPEKIINDFGFEASLVNKVWKRRKLRNIKGREFQSMNQSRKKIGCFGLSADPPHSGHLGIAKFLLRKKLVDEVWLIPCYEHSFGKPLSSSAHRWRMVKLCQGPGIKTSDVELFRKGKSYTIDTIKILQEKYPSYQFFWVIGSDIVKSGSYLRWKDWETLFFLVDFLVVLRPGFEIKKLYPGFTLVRGRISNISSSEIKEKVRHNLSIKGLVPQKVKEYIERHNLYKD